MRDLKNISSVSPPVPPPGRADLRECRELAFELKFLVPLSLGEEIRQWARARLAPDANAGDSTDAYHIRSLYFDTARLEVFHRRGSFGRSKFRIRRYGSGESVFLERKLKTRGLVVKRRSILPQDELPRLLANQWERGWAGDWFHRRLLARGLKLAALIGYRRTARLAPSHYGPARLTVDDGLEAWPADDFVFEEPRDGASPLPGRAVVELKYGVSLPALFKELVERFRLRPEPVSKYRLAMAALGLAGEPRQRPVKPEPPARWNRMLCLTF